jgi:hypothetical protein
VWAGQNPGTIRIKELLASIDPNKFIVLLGDDYGTTADCRSLSSHVFELSSYSITISVSCPHEDSPIEYQIIEYK